MKAIYYARSAYQSKMVPAEFFETEEQARTFDVGIASKRVGCPIRMHEIYQFAARGLFSEDEHHTAIWEAIDFLNSAKEYLRATSELPIEQPAKQDQE